MGCVYPGDDPAKLHKKLAQSNNIDLYAKKRALNAHEVPKLLLLGAGESGKSTIFKQMVKLSGDGFSDKERERDFSLMTNNIFAGILALIKFAKKLDNLAGLRMSKEAEEAALYLEKLEDEFYSNNLWNIEIATAVQAVWKDPCVQAVFDPQYEFNLQLSDGVSFFFDKVIDLAKEGYVMSDEDLLRVRNRTTGIIERDFKLHDFKFQLVDVGGQRSERRLWIHCFDGVTAVLYVSSLSGYDRVCYEDEKVNRMEESLDLFRDTVFSKWFKNTPIILFLNKKDLFEQKFKVSPLKHHFPEFEDFVSLPENKKNRDKNMTEMDLGIIFFMKKFEKDFPSNERRLFIHVTTATDSDNVFRVFKNIKTIITNKHIGVDVRNYY